MRLTRKNQPLKKLYLKKIDNRPKTWEEYCELTKGNTSNYANSTTLMVCKDRFNGAYNEFSTKERAEQFIAIGKLMQLRDYWVRGYKEFKYAILVTINKNILVYDWNGDRTYPHILTFPTEKMAEDFKECFSDLIKKAFLLE